MTYQGDKVRTMRMKLKKLLNRFGLWTSPASWGEFEVLMSFSYPDLVWDPSDFTKHNITDMPHPVCIGEHHDIRGGVPSENPIFRKIRKLLEIEIDVGQFSDEKHELDCSSRSAKLDLIHHHIYRSACLKNAIMIDNYSDPTNQFDFVVMGFICSADRGEDLRKLLEALITTAHTINRYGNLENWLNKLKQQGTGQSRASAYFPVKKIAHANSYQIVQHDNLPVKTTFKLGANGKPSHLVSEQVAVFYPTG